MKKKTILAMILIIYGVVGFIIGETHITEFVSFFESITPDKNIQIILMTMFFALLSIPIAIIYMLANNDKQKVEQKNG